jgi:hypothetical protein
MLQIYKILGVLQTCSITVEAPDGREPREYPGLGAATLLFRTMMTVSVISCPLLLVFTSYVHSHHLWQALQGPNLQCPHHLFLSMHVSTV